MGGNDAIRVFFVIRAQASNSKWTDLKGDFSVNKLPKLAIVYFEGPPGGVDLLLDNFAMFIPVRAKPAGPPSLKVPTFPSPRSDE